jgi:hypothetical protein
MNAVGKEYKQLGGDYKVMHHTEYLESLVRRRASWSLRLRHPLLRITTRAIWGRHNGVYDAPRKPVEHPQQFVVELRPQPREFLLLRCGRRAVLEGRGGREAERISDNRYREARKSSSKEQTTRCWRWVARSARACWRARRAKVEAIPVERKKWAPKPGIAPVLPDVAPTEAVEPKRKAWAPKKAAVQEATAELAPEEPPVVPAPEAAPPVVRKAWKPKPKE